MFVVEEFDRLVLEEDVDAALLAGFKELFHEAAAARDAFAEDAAGAAQTRIGHGTDLAELHADVGFEPVDAGGDVVRVDAVEDRIAHLLGDVHHHRVEGFGRVGDALFLLVARAPAADGAEREDGVAVGTVLLFHHGDADAEIVGRDRGDEAGGTGTENDGVISGGSLGSFGGSGVAGEAGAGDARGRAEEPGLQETAAGEFLGHEVFLVESVGPFDGVGPRRNVSGGRGRPVRSEY